MNQQLLCKIPKTDVMLARASMQAACGEVPYAIVKSVVQSYMDALRRSLLDGTRTDLPAVEDMEREILARVQAQDFYSLKRVVNATGVVLHTNLGRAPLGDEVAEYVKNVAAGYCNLEFDLETGKRGSRYTHVEKLLCDLTGAEAALVVNNNAGAVFLMLNTLAKGKKVAISRGELVEIGGSFRIPEIMEQSGAELVEVGATNKTHLADYRDAMEQKDATVLLKVHTSNFAMVGFTESVELEDMVKLGREKGAMVMYDLGSSFLFPSETLGLHEGTTVEKCVQSGADIVCFSGDKLLGSAQCGILVGKKEHIDRIRRNHLTRMLRIDKLSLAALAVSLGYYKDPYLAKEKIPALAMLSMTSEMCRQQAQALAERIGEASPTTVTEIVDTKDEAGGGSLPGVYFDGCAVAVSNPHMPSEAMERYFRGRTVPIISRIFKGKVLLSPRTLSAADAVEIAAAFAEMEKRTKGEGA